MSSKEIARQFMGFFAGREDAFGTDKGGCLRVFPGEKPEDVILDHLLGITPVGVYPMVPGLSIWPWAVKWGCVDLDVKKPGKHRFDYEHSFDAHHAAVNLQTTLKLMKLPSYIERTRSNGRHIWVFMGDWVPASDMRRALLVACQAAGVPPSEVNPKSEILDKGQLGNYVRLPYPGGLAEHTETFRQVMVTPELVRSISLTEFLRDLVWARYDDLQEAASLWEPPPRFVQWWNPEAAPLTPEIEAKLSGLGRIMLNDGPRDQDVDRSVWLFRLALQCQDDGLPPDEALSVVASADWHHTRKFVDRADGEKLLARTVEKAYAR